MLVAGGLGMAPLRSLLEKARPLLATAITGITGRRVVSLHTDISTIMGERIIVFTLEESCLDGDTEPGKAGGKIS